MTNWIAAGAAALSLGASALAPAPAQAQAQLTQADRAAHVRLAEVQAATERVQALLIGIVADPGFARADTPEKMIAALRALKPRMTAARAELRAISADFSDRPPLPASASKAPVESMERELAELVLMVDRLLVDMEGLLLAVESGDEDKIETLAVTLASGVVAMIDAQSQGLRSRAAGLPPSGSAALQLEGLACLYDGFNAFNRAQFGMIGRDEAVRIIDRSVSCMERQTRGARSALRMEEVRGGSQLGDVLTDYVQIRSAMHDQLDTIRLELAALGAGLAAGQPPEALEKRFGDAIMAFEQQLTALNGREVDLLSRLPR